MTLRLRHARAREAPHIAAILSSWIDETRWMPRIHSRAEDRAFGAFLIENSRVTVAVTRWGGVAGFLARRDFEIEALYIARRCRGCGVGRALIGRAKADRRQLALWTFQANEPARRFYRMLGFVEGVHSDGRGNEAGLPDVRMTWSRVAAASPATAPKEFSQ